MRKYPTMVEGQYLRPPELTACSLADLNDAVEAVHYALRFNAIGKARTKGEKEDPLMTANRVVAHLVQSQYVLLRRPLAPGCDVPRAAYASMPGRRAEIAESHAAVEPGDSTPGWQHSAG